MARLPFLQRGSLADYAAQFTLATYTPVLSLHGLTPGVDNVRYDVSLSAKFCDVARLHISRLIAKYGGVEDMVAPPKNAARPPSVVKPTGADEKALDPGDFKRVLGDLQLAALTRAKAEGNISLDLLARLAVLKFLRAELSEQFAVLLERCRTHVKTVESPRASSGSRAIELRERAAAFQLSKKILLRKAGQELFHTLREIEKESLRRMRRSLLADAGGPAYELFLNRLIFTKDGRDDHINAEHYVMFGNFVRDPDRYERMLQIAQDFLKSLGVPTEEERAYDSILSAPENAQELAGGGTPDDTPKGKMQAAVLDGWMEKLERADVMDRVVAAYEAAPLLAEYSAVINPQQLKNALISRAERERVLDLLDEHGKLSPANLEAAIRRAGTYRGPEHTKIAGRFLRDLIRYHRDLRRMEAVNVGMDSVNLVVNPKVRELSAINHTLYEFLLPEEQRPPEERVVHHVILKADIRDSTTLTRSLLERGLNPASHFSLNFYEPINKLLPAYGASKVFIEGDAVILALFEHEGEPAFGVARACVLAREVIDIVRGYNEVSQRSGLPTLELGIGISYQDSAPLYLMDGESRIMISKALNESDRLSSCSKIARLLLAGATESLFNVYAMETVEEADTAGSPEEFLVRYNLDGIHISEAAFRKLQQEISLQEHHLTLPPLWPGEEFPVYNGLVPLGRGSFRRLVVREGRVPHIDPRDFSFKRWTDTRYYEVCTSEAIYEYIAHGAAAGD